MGDTREEEKDLPEAKNCVSGCGLRHLPPFGKYCKYAEPGEDSTLQEQQVEKRRQLAEMQALLEEEKLKEALIQQQEELVSLEEQLSALKISNAERTTDTAQRKAKEAAEPASRLSGGAYWQRAWVLMH